MKTAIYSAAALALLLLLCSGCAGPKVVLLERADYQLTRAGDVITRDGKPLVEVGTGIWYRKGAHDKLQDRKFLPWDDGE